MLGSSYILMSESEMPHQGEKWMEVNNEDFGDDDPSASHQTAAPGSLSSSSPLKKSKVSFPQTTTTHQQQQPLQNSDRDSLNNSEVSSLKSLASQVDELSILSRNTSTRLESLERIVEQLQRALAKREQQSSLNFWFYVIVGPCCLYALLSLLRAGKSH